MNRIPDPPLLLVTDRGQARRPLPDVVEAALGARCRWISLREKDLSTDAQVALARDLMPIARRWGARLTLHGGVAIAERAGLDGVHLPAGSDPAVARARLGAHALIGLSVHRVSETASLDQGVLDYVIAGPAFETASKPGYGPALGREGLTAIVAASPVPVIAIGGIEPGNMPEALRSGVKGVAVMGSVMRAADPAAKTRALLAALEPLLPQPRPR